MRSARGARWPVSFYAVLPHSKPAGGGVSTGSSFFGASATGASSSGAGSCASNGMKALTRRRGVEAAGKSSTAPAEGVCSAVATFDDPLTSSAIIGLATIGRAAAMTGRTA